MLRSYCAVIGGKEFFSQRRDLFSHVKHDGNSARISGNEIQSNCFNFRSSFNFAFQPIDVRRRTVKEGII